MKKLFFFISAIWMAAMFVGCDSQSTGTATGPSPKKLRIAVVGGIPGEYWSNVKLGCGHGVRGLGDVDLDFRFPASRTPEAQQQLLNELVAGGVDGIAISPIDADKETDFLNQIAAKTLLVCVNSDAEKSKRACYIGTDNVAAGGKAAELLQAALPQGGKIILFVGYPNAQSTKDRVQGIQNGLAGSNIQILDTLADGTESAVAQKNAQDALTKHTDLAGMVGIYGYHGSALLTAVRGVGKTGQVKIVCFDDESDTLAGIAAGEIFGTVVQKPVEIGFQTVVRMDKYLRGDQPQLAAGKILLPSLSLTKENLAAFQFNRNFFLNYPDAQK
ncbi:MAG: substrate-binding domain-containing protein [Verrucomicrobiota bacterium]